MDIAVTPFRPADPAAAEQAYRIHRAAILADLPDFPEPSRRDFLVRLAEPLPGRQVRPALAHLDGEPVGYLCVYLPQDDNTDNATVELVAEPAHRRRGVGRALHAYAVRIARDNGRKRLVGMTTDPLAGGSAPPGAGSAFAAAAGAQLALSEVRSRLDVLAFDRTALDRRTADARSRAAGYTLVHWQDRAPDEYVDDVAYLESRLLADAPIGDLDWEPERVDAEKIRRIEAALAARGRRTYHAGARHDATGRLVAWTMLDFTDTEPWHAWQETTLVEPRHRGHRLGMLVKVENLRRTVAAEPALTAIDTWNAAENDHMISINEALGFRPVDVWHNWQQRL